MATIKRIKAQRFGYVNVVYESGREKSYYVDRVPRTVQTWLDKRPKTAASVYGFLLDLLEGEDRVTHIGYAVKEDKERVKAHCVGNPYFDEREIVDVRPSYMGCFALVYDSLGEVNKTWISCVGDNAVAWLDEHVDKATELYEAYKKGAEERCDDYFEHEYTAFLQYMCRDLWFIADQEAKIAAVGGERKETA